MSGMRAIIKKEMRSYFYSPVVYILIGFFLLVMGFIFTKFVTLYMQYNQSVQFGQVPQVTLDRLATELYRNMAFVLCFLTIFISMRLFAEEKRQQTLELLQTAPIRGIELVLGKFFAAYGVICLILLISFSYTFFMILWGNPDLNIILCTYLGLTLAMGCYIALGTLASALTSSQAIAAFITFFTLLGMYLAPALTQGVTTKIGFIEVGPSIAYLSPLSHLQSFMDGLIHFKDMVFFISFMAVVLFLTHRIVESNRWR